MKNPITRLRINQFENLYQKLKNYSLPKNEFEETYFIKIFEISFELVRKTLTSLYAYETNTSFPISTHVAFKWAFQNNFINNLKNWIYWIDLRNETVHEYIADEIYQEIDKIIPFLSDFDVFINNLKKYYEQQKI